MSGVQFEIKVITNNGAAQVAEVKTELNLTAEATTNLAGKMKGWVMLPLHSTISEVQLMVLFLTSTRQYSLVLILTAL